MIDDAMLAEKLERFADERDWRRFHTPKNIASALSVEASELLEIFQWTRGQHDWNELDAEPAVRQHTEEELADSVVSDTLCVTGENRFATGCLAENEKKRSEISCRKSTRFRQEI